MEEYESVKCEICGENNYRVIYEAQDEQRNLKQFKASSDELLMDRVVECVNCGLVYINPRLKEELIIKSYSEGSDNTFISQAAARESTFNKALEKIEKFTKVGKVLDIGTAGGSFLVAAKQRGWDVYGCELNKWLINWCKNNYGLNIKQGTIFEQNYKSNFFDLVTLWDVIEHTTNPSKIIEECNRIMKKGALLVVNYPDIDSWIARVSGRAWRFLSSVHLYYFTPKTMSLLLIKSGFKVLQIKPHFQRLQLGYILQRAGFDGFNSKMHIPYWYGQTFVLAKKI